MRVVTVFRHVPPPIIGVVGTIHDRLFEASEAALDWLETTGVLVERIDPVASPAVLGQYAVAERLLAPSGDGCLPLIVVDGRIASQGRPLTRTELARAVGAVRRASLGSVPTDPTRSAA